ncbi:MAG: carbohydrate-binding domain-containing protein [Ignavibacteria bacterium]|jgi:hypothetical protein|nr:carbohydrate-binding domain-containing protein [Ignavibacteria bacterium]
MKKLLVLFAIFATYLLVADHNIIIHQSGGSPIKSPTSAIDSMVIKSQQVNIHSGGTTSIPISGIDSITFEQINYSGDVVYITYNTDGVAVINPFENDGVSVVATGFDVVVTSTSSIENIQYVVAGSSENGSLTISSSQIILLTFNSLTLVNTNGSAINITSNKAATINLLGANYLSDGTSSTANAPLLSKGALDFVGIGSLTIDAYPKHAISSSKAISIENATLIVNQSGSDGLHCEGFTMASGSIITKNTAGDGIDAGGETLVMNGGSINITNASADVKGMKCDGVMTINGGTITMAISGEQSKAISSKSDIFINGGNINITCSGAVVLETSGSGFDPSYCTAIKATGNVTITDGNITIASTSSANGGKGISADGNVTIANGNINITTAGAGATYTNEYGEKDSYTACCIKSDANIFLLGGNITCSSSGAGGKGISADSTMSIGKVDADNSELIIDVSTSGLQFLVSGATGGGGHGKPPQEDADYANPKAIKSYGNLTVHSGTITINCTQSSGEGGEGLESKDTLRINGGLIDINSTSDDCINAEHHIAISGGNVYCKSTANDGIDCNGTLTISGGFIISQGATGGEDGFDCDNNTFAITGGTAIGIGGATSSPTTSKCMQRVVKYTASASTISNKGICIKDAAGNAILTYLVPQFSTSGGGQGGGSSLVLLITLPEFADGSYTLQYGGTITGGTNDHGYITGGTYSGGTSKNFTISSMVTSVQ